MTENNGCKQVDRSGATCTNIPTNWAMQEFFDVFVFASESPCAWRPEILSKTWTGSHFCGLKMILMMVWIFFCWGRHVLIEPAAFGPKKFFWAESGVKMACGGLGCFWGQPGSSAARRGVWGPIFLFSRWIRRSWDKNFLVNFWPSHKFPKFFINFRLFCSLGTASWRGKKNSPKEI